MVIESHIVPYLTDRPRLSDYAGGIFKAVPSRKGMKKAIDRKLVLLNGRTANTADLLNSGDIISLLEDTKRTRPEIELKLPVLFEDEHIAVVFKPAGMEVSGNRKWTLENALSFNLKHSSQMDALRFPEPIHRLDYPTSGVLLIGKTATAVMALNKLFEERNVEKTYHAVTIGRMQNDGAIELPVDGKAASSTYAVSSTITSERFGHLNLVELKPHTGRRHQLRKHLAGIGNPILGDRDYGKSDLLLSGKGLYLHASSLRFRHPQTGETLEIGTPLPKKFRKLFP